MEKKYPNCLIDRSRRSRQAKEIYDFVTCTDEEVGFIARCWKVSSAELQDMRERVANLPPQKPQLLYTFDTGKNGIMFEIVKFLHPPVTNHAKLHSLVKKHFRRYLFEEVESIKGDGSDLDSQILAIEDVARLCCAQKNRLVEMNGEGAAKDFTDTIHDAAESLRLLKKLLGNFKTQN